MSRRSLYDNLMKSIKISGGDTEEVFFTFVEALKRKYPKCHTNFNVKMRNAKTATLKAKPFKNAPKMYYAIFKATEERCKSMHPSITKSMGGTRKKTNRK